MTENVLTPFRGPVLKHRPPAMDSDQGPEPTEGDLEYARVHGKFQGTEPSELFLKMYWHSLQPLSHDPTANVCSTNFAGTTGTNPLTIVSVIPDIMSHYYNLISTANREILLATNLWKNSQSSQQISAALLALSKRSTETGRRVSVKILFLRFSLRHIYTPRVEMGEDEWSGSWVGLPKRSQIPNVDLRVIKYHNIPMGTFHPKFLVVDRRVACLNSCNIQDNANFEMMCHFEGGVVENVVDYFRASWDPNLSAEEFAKEYDGCGHDDLEGALSDWDDVIQKGNARILPMEGETSLEALTRSLNWKTPPHPNNLIPTSTHDYTPYISTNTTSPIPMALVNRKPFAGTLTDPLWDRSKLASHTPQNEAWLAGIRYASNEVFIQSPDLNTEPIMEAIVDAVLRGVKVVVFVCLGYNDLGEMMPYQGGHNDSVIARLYKLVEVEKEKRMAVQHSRTMPAVLSHSGDSSSGVIDASKVTKRTGSLPLDTQISQADELVVPKSKDEDIPPPPPQHPEDLLSIHYYTSADTTRPLHASSYTRTAHIKLMIIDRRVGIMGSGNQDTQSWYHSQEINIMVDSEEVVGKWYDAVIRNQNTMMYGKVGRDGWWKPVRNGGNSGDRGEGDGTDHDGEDENEGMSGHDAYGPATGLWNFGRAVKRTAVGFVKGALGS